MEENTAAASFVKTGILIRCINQYLMAIKLSENGQAADAAGPLC